MEMATHKAYAKNATLWFWQRRRRVSRELMLWRPSSLMGMVWFTMWRPSFAYLFHRIRLTASSSLPARRMWRMWLMAIYIRTFA